MLLSVSVMAQDSSTQPMPLRVAAFADNGVHPGLKVGTNYLLKENVKVRTRKLAFLQNKKGSKTKVIQYKLDGNLGFYNHPNNHSGIFIGTGITRHKNKNESKLSSAWSLEINYLQRLYNIKTYELDPDGTIIEPGLSGNGGLMLALAPSIEREFGKNGLIIYIKPSFQLVKYNHSYSPNAALELGISKNLSK